MKRLNDWLDGQWHDLPRWHWVVLAMLFGIAVNLTIIKLLP